jgi:uncharacterized DUF497 family protein
MPFELVAEIEWETASFKDDQRRDYGERRIVVVGFIGRRLHVAIVTHRGDAVHVISFHKANRKEIRTYGQRI